MAARGENPMAAVNPARRDPSQHEHRLSLRLSFLRLANASQAEALS